MRKRFSAAALAVFVLATASVPSSAQVLSSPDDAAVEFWSSRYRRFHETQNGTRRPIVDETERPAGGLLAPPDIFICQPQSFIAPTGPITADRSDNPSGALRMSEAEMFGTRLTFGAAADGSRF